MFESVGPDLTADCGQRDGVFPEYQVHINYNVFKSECYFGSPRPSQRLLLIETVHLHTDNSIPRLKIDRGLIGFRN